MGCVPTAHKFGSKCQAMTGFVNRSIKLMHEDGGTKKHTKVKLDHKRWQPRGKLGTAQEGVQGGGGSDNGNNQ